MPNSPATEVMIKQQSAADAFWALMAHRATAMADQFGKLAVPDFMLPPTPETEPALDRQEPPPLGKLEFGL